MKDTEIIKTSKVLDDLIEKLFDVCDDAAIWLEENSEYIEDEYPDTECGIEIGIKSQKMGKPIYRVEYDSYNCRLVYFIGTIDEIKATIEHQIKEEENLEADARRQEMELELDNLKKQLRDLPLNKRNLEKKIKELQSELK